MRPFTCFFSAIVLLALMSVGAVAEISYVTVTTQGTGQNERAAIYDALKSAIEQVNGAQIAAQTALSTAEAAASNSDGESTYVSSEAFAQQIASKTKGTIKEFRIIRSGTDESLGGLHTADLEVVVAKFERSGQLNRKRLAVMPFRLDPSISKQNGDIIGEAFSQKLVTFLTQTRKFALLEREYLAEQQAELGIITSGQTPVEELAKLAQKVSADIILVGTITKAKTHTNTISSPVTGISRTTYIGNVNVSFRVIDAVTGQIKWADTYASSAEAEQAGGVLTTLASRAADAVGEEVLGAIYPVTVSAVSGDELVLGQGGKTIEVGQRFKLILLGQNIQDKYTGESIGPEEIIVGEIEIVSVTPRQSRARVIRAKKDPFSMFGDVEFIVRPFNKEKGRAQVKAKQIKEVKKKLDAGFDSFEKQNSENW